MSILEPQYLLAFFSALALSLLFTPLIGKLAWKLEVIDKPGGPRKIHQRPTPLMGGLAIFLSFSLIMALNMDGLLAGDLSSKHWLGVILGGLFLMIGGYLDDRYNLKPLKQLIFPLLAILSVIWGGVEIGKISNPLGDYLYLSGLLSVIFVGLWLLGMMYTTKLLDGVDGLVSGVVFIGALIIFLFTLTTKYYQPDIALAASIFGGAILGFWFFNFNPAKIFLGEGGSLFLGYLLGVLAIISGGKIAIALLVMGIPVLDLLWTIIRRIWRGKNPFRFSDKKHLHHRLLALGLGPKRTVLIFYALSLIFGLGGLFLQSRGKLLALALMLGLMFVAVIAFWFFEKRGGHKKTLLLHVCCAPCSAYLAKEILSPHYQVTLYFDNSNLDTLEEYELRLGAVKSLAEKYNFPLIVAPYEPQLWQEQVRGREKDKERGLRCRFCYVQRLRRLAVLAKAKNFNTFSSSLMVSPYKDREALKLLGESLGREFSLPFAFYETSDELYQKSQTRAKELGFYRQKYCGCSFSKR